MRTDPISTEPRALIVEDEALIAEELRERLSRLGITVHYRRGPTALCDQGQREITVAAHGARFWRQHRRILGFDGSRRQCFVGKTGVCGNLVKTPFGVRFAYVDDLAGRIKFGIWPGK